ncbi:hypothetical protein ZWY2020_037079 [Hordeum vulgare]|nr:hypothetical protein ZWY2020_037079 [Hordeum vulgare]
MALAPAFGNSFAQGTCFNCGVFGHSPISCSNPPYFYLCQDPGHPALLYLDLPVMEELMMYGHGIEGVGFFHIEVPDIPPPTPPPLLLAMVTVLGEGVASRVMIEAKLNHCCHYKWGWQMTPTSENVFMVLFPDAVSHGYGTRTGEITLTLNKLMVYISEPVRAPKAPSVLHMAWILIGDFPDIARSERVICHMSRFIGVMVVVDKLSLRKEEEVRVKVKSFDSSKLRTTVRVFFNDQGFDLRVSPEPPTTSVVLAYLALGVARGLGEMMATRLQLRDSVATSRSSVLLRPAGLAVGPNSDLSVPRVYGGDSGGHHTNGIPPIGSSLGCLLHTGQSILDVGDILVH